MTTANAAAPDVRDPQSPLFQRISGAYERAVGSPMPLAAIGGGTDAKGQVNLVAAGPLFTVAFGPPINYHGLDEGAPIEDLQLGARILNQIMLDEIASKTAK